MTEQFEFEEEGRKYTCCLEVSHPSRAEKWWYFGVTGDRSRYAPFQGAAGDTQKSVQSRILAYYTALLEHRATVVPYRPFGGKKR
jgi:hypothetical protein